MTRYRVRQLALRGICHATESYKLVQTALLYLIPPSLHTLGLEVTDAFGSFSNSIKIMSLTVNKQANLRKIFRFWFQELSPENREVLINGIEDGCNEEDREIVFRLDKGKACESIVRLSKGSYTIHVAIKFEVHGKADCATLCSLLFSQGDLNKSSN